VGIVLAASEPCSGLRDLTGNALMGSPDIAGKTRPSYLAFVACAYHAYYDSSAALGIYFTPPVLACANSNFAGGWYGFTMGSTTTQIAEECNV
jgi:hypothetical protein